MSLAVLRSPPNIKILAAITSAVFMICGVCLNASYETISNTVLHTSIVVIASAMVFGAILIPFFQAMLALYNAQ